MTKTDVDAIRLSPSDNVATVLRGIAAGDAVRLRDAVVTATDAIPACHKIALVAIGSGEPVRKYGQQIGAAARDVEAGAHVHVHNMRSARARLDGTSKP